MSKLVRIEPAWLDQYRDLMVANYALGKFLSDELRLEDRLLRVWLPEGHTHLPMQSLDHDMFVSEETFPHWEETCSFLDSFLTHDPSKFLLSGTYRDITEPSLRPLPVIPWLALKTAKENVPKVCVYVPGNIANPQMYDEFLSEASPTPQVVVLTSLDSGYSLSSGQEVETASKLFESLLHGIEHVVMGVFDN